ncbi:MAG: POTRA domain-containing protein [Bryobacterales bacterium]
MKVIRPTVVLPGLRLSKAYTNERVAESVARLRGALLREGRFDAWVAPVRENVRPDRVEVRFDIDRGPQFHVGEATLARLDGSQLKLTEADGGFPVEAICDSLLDQRAEAERQGRLDFAATLEVRPLPPLPNSPRRTAVTGAVIASEPLSIRQIHFRSDARLGDSALRNALRIEEAAPLDSARLRRSLASLNRFMLLKPVSQGDIEIKRVAPGQADVTFHLHKQNARRWTIGGPLGPMSLFGPLHGRLETRLPPWGRGLLDLSTYTVGGWLTGAPALVLKNDAWVWKTIWRPSLVLSRPALPGSGLTSGYLWSPQLSPSQLLAANGALRARSQLARWVEGDPPAPPLHVSVTHVERGPLGSIVCREGRDWTDRLRTAGKLALSIAGL